MTTMKTVMAALAGFSMLVSGSAFAAKGGRKADTHHSADSKGVPSGQRPKGRVEQYNRQSAAEQRAMQNGTKRQDLKEMNRQNRARQAAKGKKGGRG